MIDQPPPYVPKTVWRPIKVNVFLVLTQIANFYKTCDTVKARPFFMLCALATLEPKDRTAKIARYSFTEVGKATQCAAFLQKLCRKNMLSISDRRYVIPFNYNPPINANLIWNLFKILSAEITANEIIFLSTIIKNDLHFTITRSRILEITKHVCSQGSADKYINNLVDKGYIIKNENGVYIISTLKFDEIQLTTGV